MEPPRGRRQNLGADRARPSAGRRAARCGSPGRTRARRVCLVLTRGLFPPQMVMQYLYYGGTEAMHVPAADVLEVRARRWGWSSSRGLPGTGRLES